jgi:hypothetical protein
MKSIYLFFLGFILTTVYSESLVTTWDFSKGIDSDRFKFISRGHTARINGALETGESPRTQAEGIQAAGMFPELSPPGGFRLSLKFALKKPSSSQRYLMLWDSKCDFYAKKNSGIRENSGFTVALQRLPSGYRPRAWLGFGRATATLAGKTIKLAVGKTYTLTFDYDGAARAKFSLDGVTLSTFQVNPGGPVAPSCFRPVIGDRVLGNYFRFDGRIFKVSLYSRPAARQTVKIIGRRVFIRNEKNATLQIEVRKLSGQKECRRLAIPVETRLSCGSYRMPLRLDGETFQLNYRIGPILHDAMPVMMWYYCDSFRILQNAGFTHGLKSLTMPLFLHPGSQARINREFVELDEMLAAGFRRADYFNIGHSPKLIRRFPRINRQGKPIIVNRKMNIDANNPAAVKVFADNAEYVSHTYGTHPALDLLDVNSEIRDRTAPSFSKYEPEAFKKFSGFPLPAQINHKKASYKSLSGFPASRLVPDNYPPFVYYRWFWKNGDGWNPMHSLVSEIYHKNIKHHFRSYFAPAARQPPIWGAGGKVDILGQWGYAYPDPLRLGSMVDELLAMAAERPGIPVMAGIQLICYRSQTAPVGQKVNPEPDWVKKHPKARYITIPPDSLTEAVWSCISRRVEGLVFHGGASLFPPPFKGAAIYVMTNPDTEAAFRKIIDEVIKPFGPLLKQLPERKRDIALLHSFTSAVFAGRGSYGWGGRLMDTHLALQWGGFDPRVIYEEEILRDKLKDVKVLVLAHCDVLPEAVYREIAAFQLRGGIVVTDETRVPALLPDVRLEIKPRKTRDAEKSKKNFQELGKKLRHSLEKYYTPFNTSDNSDLITHVRGNYLFVINDKRGYGSYFGPWRRTQEKGLPNSGTVTVRRPVGAVYDVIRHRQIPFKSEGGITSIPLEFGTNDGKLLLLLPAPITELKVGVPAKVKSGQTFVLEVKVNAKARLPLKIEVLDAKGRKTDDSAFAAAAAGEYKQSITVPLNAEPGRWRILVRELASGKNATVSVVVESVLAGTELFRQTVKNKQNK